MSGLLLCLTQITPAETLPDPTRPSIDLNSSGVSSAADAVPVDTAPRGLQTIIISPKYRAAIINGETVSLGGISGDARLVEVRENSVILENARGRRVMELFPRVNIRKNEAMQQIELNAKTSEQKNLPEQAVGGSK